MVDEEMRNRPITRSDILAAENNLRRFEMQYEALLEGKYSEVKHQIFAYMNAGLKRSDIERLVHDEYSDVPMKQIRTIITRIEHFCDANHLVLCGYAEANATQ